MKETANSHPRFTILGVMGKPGKRKAGRASQTSSGRPYAGLRQKAGAIFIALYNENNKGEPFSR